MEEKYINPWAEFLFEANCKEGDTVRVIAEDAQVKFVKGE
jgi:hypothetical protein